MAGYDVNLAASLVGYAASRVGEEIAKNAKIIHGDSPGAEISERVVTLAKITGWRIGTAVSTIAMASVEQGMLQADVNALVQSQVPAISSQATAEANIILQSMYSTTNVAGMKQSTVSSDMQNTNNDDKKNSNKSEKGEGSSGGSGGTGGSDTAQVTSAPEAAILAMQQAQQVAVARWMNDLQSQQAAIMPGVLNPLAASPMLLDPANASKTNQAVLYSNLLMGLTSGANLGEAAGVDVKTKTKTTETKRKS